MQLRTLLQAVIAASALMASRSALGQNGPTLVQSGRALPTLSVAPGQIVTLQVTGLKTVYPQPIRATKLPLPTALGNLSITIVQQTHGGPVSTPVPLLSIEQTNRCSGDALPTMDCLITSITVQIPFEMTVVPFSGSPQTSLVISENGVAGRAFAVTPTADSIHILTGCGPNGEACVTHADGTLVDSGSPAKPGEEVVIYAIGLGLTNPPVATGVQTATPAPVSSHVFLQFDFSTNAGPTRPFVNPLGPQPSPMPDFAGLTPGQVGLYQVNLRLPDTMPPLRLCDSSSAPWTVLSNLTITVSSNYYSWDGAAICVAAQ